MHSITCMHNCKIILGICFTIVLRFCRSNCYLQFTREKSENENIYFSVTTVFLTLYIITDLLRYSLQLCYTSQETCSPVFFNHVASQVISEGIQ